MPPAKLVSPPGRLQTAAIVVAVGVAAGGLGGMALRIVLDPASPGPWLVLGLTAATGCALGLLRVHQGRREIERLSGEIRDRPRGGDTADARVRLSPAEWSDLFESLEWGVAVEEPHCQTLGLMNAAFARLHRSTVEELRGRPIDELLTPEARAARGEMVRRAEAEGHLTWECERRRVDGTTFPALVHMTLIRDVRGDVIRRVIGLADITERRALETRLRRAQHLESIGQLAAGIAHEINSPTQYIGDNIRFLQDAFRDLTIFAEQAAELVDAAERGAPPASRVTAARRAMDIADLKYLASEIPRAIEQSLDGVGRVSEIVRAMKDFSHPNTEVVVSDLNRAIQSTLAMARSEWKYVAEIETDLDPDLPGVPCRPGEIGQAVLNILVNAAHAVAQRYGDAGRKGTIRLTTRRVGNVVELRISDNGPGIPEAIRERIFQPFFTTKPIGQGTGQGLSIAHGVVVQGHGGALECESVVGGGTSFVIRLPLDAPAPAREAAGA